LLGRWHAADRVLLACLAVGCVLRPVFLLPFVIESRVIASQFDVPFHTTAAQNIDALLLIALVAVAATHLWFVATGRRRSAPVILVLTAAIAVRAAQAGLRPVCLDGDRLGGGLDVTLGVEQEPGVRWPDLVGVRGQVDGPELLRRLPSVDDVSVLSFDRARDVRLDAGTVEEVLRALSTSVDLVVVDLPRPDHEVFAAMLPAVDAVVLLAGSGVCDLAGASAIAEHLVRGCPDVWLCLRTSGRGSHFADTVAGALDLPMLAVVREEPSLAADLLHGIPPGSSSKGALAAAADKVLAQCVAGARRWAS